MAYTLHATKNRKLATGEKPWWVIIIGRGKARERFTVQGTEVEIMDLESKLKTRLSKTQVSGKATKQKVLQGGERAKKYVPAFLVWYRDEVETSTYNDCLNTVNKVVLPHCGNMFLHEITASYLKGLRTTLRRGGLKAVTINKHFSYFSKYLKWCKDEEYLDAVPDFPRFSAKKIAAPKTKPLTRDEVNSLFENIQPKYHLIFLSMADMGLRRDEAMGLNRKSIDLDNRRILIRGKGVKDRYIPFITDRFERAVNIACEQTKQGPLSINPQTKKEYYSIRKELIRAAKKAGIDQPVDHHLLRHSFATWLAKEGYNPHAVQMLLGHSSMETTLKIYTHIGADFVTDHVQQKRQEAQETTVNTPEKQEKQPGMEKVVNSNTYKTEKKAKSTVPFIRRVK